MCKISVSASLMLLVLLAAQPAQAVRIGDFVPRDGAPAQTPATKNAPVVTQTPTPPAMVIPPVATKPLTPNPAPVTKPDPLRIREQGLMRQFDNPPVDLNLVFELAETRRALALRAYQQGDTAAAFDLMGNALQLDPNQPEAWETLGDWSLELPAPDGDAMAYYAYNEVVQLLPDQPRAHLKLAAIVTGHGDYPRAIKHLEQALSSDRAALQWNHLALLNTLYLRNNSPVQGMHFLRSRFDATGDDRFLLAEAILMDALGQGEPAAQLARLVAESDSLPDVLRQYATVLGDKFASAGNQRLYGKTSAGEGWLINTEVAQ